jgi:DNA-binding PadR family transcriptional regulator
MVRQGSAEKEQWSGSLLQRVLLALLLEQPLHGYVLATMLERRLGPAWSFSRQGVYEALKRLEHEDLVSCSSSANKQTRGRRHRQEVYAPTSRAEATLAAWMQSPVRMEPQRVELHARIAMSREADAPQLLRALDAYERDCKDRLRETADAEVRMGSWRALTLNVALGAVIDGLQAELQWIVRTRREIEDFVATCSAGTAR